MTPQELINLRRSLGLTRRDLAARIGKSTVTLKRIEGSSQTVSKTLSLAIRAVTGTLDQDLRLLPTPTLWTGESIKALRENHEPKLTQTHLAIILGVPRNTVTHLETKPTSTPPMDMQAKLDIVSNRLHTALELAAAKDKEANA